MSAIIQCDVCSRTICSATEEARPFELGLEGTNLQFKLEPMHGLHICRVCAGEALAARKLVKLSPWGCEVRCSERPPSEPSDALAALDAT